MTTETVTVHPAPAESPASADYTVTVNGRPVFVHQARVSAQPINQVWPGYQRPVGQTEIAAFASWDMRGPVEVAVTSARPMRDARVRPSSRGIKPSTDGNVLRFRLERPGQLSVEVNGMRRALHLFADPPEADAPDPNDPSVLYFGPGVHSPGIVRMTGGQTVYIAGGAVVYGAFAAEKAENIAIRGRGILDGGRLARGETRGLINTIGCRHVDIEGITLRDPPGWTLVPVLSSDVRIRNVKLVGLWRYNADGIDFVNSRDCSVEDSFVRSFDDCIVFKGLKSWAGASCGCAPVADIRVRRCVLWCDWGRALEIGAETVADEIAGLRFDDCDVIHSLDVAMEVQNGDRARCHDLLFRNIRVELDDDQTRPVYQKEKDQVYAETARHVSQLIVLVTSATMWSKDTVRGRVDDIRFQDIDVTAWTVPELYFAGLDAEHMVRDVTIENLRINGRRVRTMDDARFSVKDFVRDVRLK